MMNDRIRLGMIVLVGSGWLFNLIVPAFVPSYESNLAANGPLLLVLGAVFATKKKRGTTETGDDE